MVFCTIFTVFCKKPFKRDLLKIYETFEIYLEIQMLIRVLTIFKYRMSTIFRNLIEQSFISPRKTIQIVHCRLHAVLRVGSLISISNFSIMKKNLSLLVCQTDAVLKRRPKRVGFSQFKIFFKSFNSHACG